jgi:hypothetical protein
MWPALSFAISLAVVSGGVYYDWMSNIYAVITLILTGAAMSIAFAWAMRSSARRDRRDPDDPPQPMDAFNDHGETAALSGPDLILPRR